MAFDPNWPPTNEELDSAKFRIQFTGLHDEIPSSAVVDSVITNGAGSGASATATLTAGVLHLSFAIPEGPLGPQGNPGEVTQTQLSNDLANTQNATLLATLPLTSANSNGVPLLSISSGDFAIQTLIDAYNSLVVALRR